MDNVYRQPLNFLKQKPQSSRIAPQEVGKTLIWAIDPSEKDLSRMQKVAQILKAFAKHEEVIQPVSVVSPLDFGWPFPVPLHQVEDFELIIGENLSELLEKLKAPMESLQILTSPNFSSKKSIEQLVQYSEEQNAKFIAVHSVKTKPHMTGFGSFTELLIGISNLPVLFVGDQVDPVQNISNILFPTDFSASSKKSFRNVLEIAREYEAEVILYHHIQPIIEPFVPNAYGITPDQNWVQKLWDEEHEFGQKKGQAWVQQGQGQGIPCRFILDHELGTLSDRILKAARKEKIDLIVAEGRRGPWGQRLFGKNLRQLFSKTRNPLIVIHNK